MARKSTVATLCAVAASKFDLTDEPYDLIIRLSAEKPTRRRCTYWPGPARHYSKAGNDARRADPERAGLKPARSSANRSNHRRHKPTPDTGRHSAPNSTVPACFYLH